MPIKDPIKRALYQKKWYQKNKEECGSSLLRRRRDAVKWLDNYKLTLSCVQCGESDNRCLDFHHRDRKTKEFEVTIGNQQGNSRQRVLDEIAKCDVLCANCHRKLHYDERKAAWYRNKEKT